MKRINKTKTPTKMGYTDLEIIKIAYELEKEGQTIEETKECLQELTDLKIYIRKKHPQIFKEIEKKEWQIREIKTMIDFLMCDCRANGMKEELINYLQSRIKSISEESDFLRNFERIKEQLNLKETFPTTNYLQIDYNKFDMENTNEL